MKCDDGKVLFFENADIFDNQLFFVDFDITFLFSYSFLDEKVRVVSKIPELPLFFQRAFGAVCISKGQVYLAPQLSDKLRIYNIRTKEWKSIKVGRFTSSSLQFRCMTSLNNKIYLAGYDEGGLLCVDESNLHVQCLNSKDKFGLGYERSGDYLFFPIRQRNVLLKVDTLTNEIEEIKINYNNGFCDVAFYDSSLYLAPEHLGPLLRSDYKMNSFSNKVIQVNEIGESVSRISGLARYGTSLRMFTRHTDKTINYYNGNVTMISGPSMCCFAANFEENSCILCKLYESFSKVNADNLEKKWSMFFYENDLKKACRDNNVNICGIPNTIMNEERWLSLDYYLKSLIEI